MGTGYMFDNDRDEAVNQHRHLGEILDPGSREALLQAGLQRGWRCWDIGAGGGSLTTWIAEQVGPEGSVLATDLKPQHLPTAANLEVRAHDVCSDEVPESEFDLIHARLVLMHLPEREAVLRRLVPALKPGGTLILSDWEIGDSRALLLEAPDAASAELFVALHDALVAFATARGADVTWARRTFVEMRKAGLTNVESRVTGEAWPAGSPGADLYLSNSRQLQDGIVATTDATNDQFEQLRKVITHPNFVVSSYLMHTTVGRRAA
jgi:SAM-dependent methyltransferase